MFYELMDVETANLVGAYGTEEDALAIVRSAVERLGPEAIMSLALATSDEDGDGELIAAGEALLERAQRPVTITRNS